MFVARDKSRLWSSKLMRDCVPTIFRREQMAAFWVMRWNGHELYQSSTSAVCNCHQDSHFAGSAMWSIRDSASHSRMIRVCIALFAQSRRRGPGTEGTWHLWTGFDSVCAHMFDHSLSAFLFSSNVVYTPNNKWTKKRKVKQHQRGCRVSVWSTLTVRWQFTQLQRLGVTLCWPCDNKNVGETKYSNDHLSALWFVCVLTLPLECCVAPNCRASSSVRRCRSSACGHICFELWNSFEMRTSGK